MVTHCHAVRSRGSTDQPARSDSCSERRLGKTAKELILLDDVLTRDRPAVFSPSKDRPILFSALAWADVLLTLDRGDFADLLGRSFYDLAVLKPGNFLQRERAAGRLSIDSPAQGDL